MAGTDARRISRRGFLRDASALGAVTVLPAVLSACGGDSAAAASSGSGPLQGVWSGTMQETAGGEPVTLEVDQRHDGNVISGHARLTTADGTIYAGVLHGTDVNGRVSWQVDFGPDVGVLQFDGMHRNGTIEFQYSGSATGFVAGAGSISMVAALSLDLSGTYRLDWETSNPLPNASGCLTFQVFFDGTRNFVAQFPIAEIPGGFVSVLPALIGSSFSMSIGTFDLVAPGTNRVTFNTATLGGTGTYNQITDGQAGSGTYTTTRMNPS
jgi:hypothetical protein